MCISCGHNWFSRSSHVPLRCLYCKTHSWTDPAVRGAGEAGRIRESLRTKEIARLYQEGNGCVRITVTTDIPLFTAISVLKKGVCNGRTLNM